MNECEEFTTKKIIPLTENKSCARFLNPSEIELLVVTVDDCAITGEEERCDYLVRRDSHGWFVELKGSDTEKALRQIQNTVSKLAGQYEIQTITMVIVSTKVPAISGFQKKAEAIRKNLKGFHPRVILKNRVVEISIDN